MNIRIIGLAAFLAILSTSFAYADETSSSAGSTAISGSASGAQAGSHSDAIASPTAAASLSLIQEGSRIPTPAPDVILPQINNTANCVVAMSGGASGPGFGISFGMGTKDEDCRNVNLAIAVSNMGHPVQGMVMLCTLYPVVQAAFDRTHRSCDEPIVAAQAPVQAAAAPAPVPTVAPVVRRHFWHHRHWRKRQCSGHHCS